MSAAAAGNVEGVKWLLQAGADAAATDARGRTASDYASTPKAKVRSTHPRQYCLLCVHLPTNNRITRPN
jgi:hypothetical protein